MLSTYFQIRTDLWDKIGQVEGISLGKYFGSGDHTSVRFVVE